MPSFATLADTVRQTWQALPVLLLLLLLLASAGGMVLLTDLDSLQQVWTDRYTWYLLRFASTQALLSTLCSLLLAVGVARALQRRRLPWPGLWARGLTLCMMLPTLTVVLALLQVHGNAGWLAQWWPSTSSRSYIYGLEGIVLAHIFLNLPIAARLFLNALQSIPSEHWRLASQFGLSPARCFFLLEWPALRRALAHAGALIFTLCLTSFAIVLALGGGPRASTLEVEIYQALRLEFDLPRAAALCLLQLLIAALVIVALGRLAAQPNVADHALARRSDTCRPDTAWCRLHDLFWLTLAALLLLPILLALLTDMLQAPWSDAWGDPALWRATGYSLLIALSASALSTTLALWLLNSSAGLSQGGRFRALANTEIFSILLWAMPAFFMAMGWFFLWQHLSDTAPNTLVLIIVSNALMSLPFALSCLSAPFRQARHNSERLCRSLGLSSWTRWRIALLPVLRAPLATAWIFCAGISLTDFGVIALFGDAEMQTLPLLLYRSLGSYRYDYAGAVSSWLILLMFIGIGLLDRLGRHTDA